MHVISLPLPPTFAYCSCFSDSNFGSCILVSNVMFVLKHQLTVNIPIVDYRLDGHLANSTPTKCRHQQRFWTFYHLLF